MARARVGDAHIAIAYLRASTDEQRLGPEAQRASIETWAAREGVHVTAWHIDQGVSGAAPIEERSGLCEALAGIRAHGAGLFVVAKRDRIARDVVVAALVERAVASNGARVVSAGGEGNGMTPADAFMRTMIDGAAAYERALIRSRTKAALGAKRAKGQRVSRHAPYGFHFEGDRVVPDDEEQRTLTRARKLRGEGMTLAAVAAALEGEGARNRAGGRFAVSAVHAMLAGGVAA